jgi:divalent metal cation (Fe/Co/Zn/Cd) transporter
VLVSALIVQQGWGIMMTSFRQLTDAGVSLSTKTTLLRALEPMVPRSQAPTVTVTAPRAEKLLGIEDLRATRAGSMMFVDLTAKVPSTLSVADTSALEDMITRTLKEARKEVKEVRVKFDPVETK